MAFTRSSISLLDADPEIRQFLPPGEWDAARTAARASLVTVPVGAWKAELRPEWHRGFGLLLVQGLIARTVTLLGRTSIELIGPDDLIRPWDEASEAASVSFDVGWEALQEVRLAVLDQQFASRVAPWPMISSALVARSARRARWLGLHTAVLENPRVSVRLLLLLWHLADRWGHVAPEGVVVPVDLTHRMLGRLVRAQRPSVTAGVLQLERRGMLTRRPNRRWVLHGEADAQLRILANYG